MPKTLMWVDWDAGTKLSRSHKKPGDYSSNLRGRDRNNAGQATLRIIDEREFGYIVNWLLSSGTHATAALRGLMWVEWNDGDVLSQSRLRPGAYSPLTRDRDGHLVGQATLRDVEEHEVGFIVDCLRQHSTSTAYGAERRYARYCGAGYGEGGRAMQSSLGRDLLVIAIDAFAEAVGSSLEELGHELVSRLAHSTTEWARTKFASPTAVRPRPDPEHRAFVDRTRRASADMDCLRDDGSPRKHDRTVGPGAQATAA